ncbi:Epimerase family protein [Anatilimnocola aggregata]|uniref:Epimerase family protein n=1 Tax=Anatilimnocola aggregata TaxID=2528021 RepID=A0A517YLG7_9BACT|nr:TIGR01777 family oxidoreductase [Anatilimnocola aggregata]QDU31069.1 Epimerase family protein [Anatilimnocola aggregata]
MTHTFERRSQLPVSAAEAYAWHLRPGAFERLSPPWETVKVLKREGTIETGGTVQIAVPVGPLSIRWLAKHHDFLPGQEFHDTQVTGPFAKWEHTHRFEAQSGGESTLLDHIEYKLPAGGVGNLVAGNSIRHKLERMFAYRHRVTLADIQAHARYAERDRMHIAITGASGLVGSALAAFLSTGGHRVTKLNRSRSNKQSQDDGLAAAAWNAETGAIDIPVDDFPEVVVHLAGENIAGSRWNAKVKDRIKQSRVGPTRQLCEKLATAPRKPSVLICASAIGYYGDRGEEVLTEESAPGEGFLADVCREWEAATQPAVDAGIRVVNARFGMIVTTAGGALAKMLTPFKLGGGGIVGSGKQYWSWITLDDVIGAIHHSIMAESLRGPVNVVAPETLNNHDFTKVLGQVLHRPTIMPLPAFAARLMLGEMADELLLASARVVPAKLEATQYPFRFPTLAAGLRHVLGKIEKS